MNPIIEVKNLKYKYPHTDKLVLDDISFTIEKGEFIGIVGANGAGKSTLTQALVGLVPQFYKGAYGGQVLVDGMQASKDPIASICKKVGLVFQNPFNQLSGAKDTVYEEIAFGLQNFGIERDEMVKRIEDAIKLLDIAGLKDRNPFDLSGGQMQRVAIASILVMQPEIMILDEPTSQLDPAGTEEVFKAVEKLVKAGKTILIVEQKIEKISAYCDKILLMHEGRIVDFDTPQKIFSRDDLEEIGVQAPSFTRICKALNVRLADGNYPVTRQEVVSIKDVLPRVSAEHSIEESEKKQLPMFFTIKNMDFSYHKDTSVITDCNLELDGRPTAIIGQNGAGKTTLIKMIMGILDFDEGDILVEGKSIKDSPIECKKVMAYLPDNPDLYENMKAIDYINFVCDMYDVSSEIREKNILKYSRLLEMDKNLNDEISSFSHGMKQKIALISALCHEPKILVMDEPFVGLDPKAVFDMKKIMKDMVNEGKIVFYSTHILDVAEKLCDEVAIIKKGKLIKCGTMKEIKGDESLEEVFLELGE